MSVKKNKRVKFSLACVASFSVGFGSKELQRENGASKRRGRGRGRGRIPSFPSLTPIFHFWLSPHFLRGQNTKNSVLSAPKPHGNACYAG